MTKVLEAIGGRKMALVLVCIILVALRNVLSLDDEQIKTLIWLALGGSGAIALEDGIKSITNKPPKK